MSISCECAYENAFCEYLIRMNGWLTAWLVGCCPASAFFALFCSGGHAKQTTDVFRILLVRPCVHASLCPPVHLSGHHLLKIAYFIVALCFIFRIRFGIADLIDVSTVRMLFFSGDFLGEEICQLCRPVCFFFISFLNRFLCTSQRKNKWTCVACLAYTCFYYIKHVLARWIT